MFIPAHARLQPTTDTTEAQPDADHDPTRAEGAAELMQKRAAENAAEDEAMLGCRSGGVVRSRPSVPLWRP